MEVLRFIGRNSKRVAVTLVGAAVVVAGLAMLVLPGPGIVVVVLGFAILGTEYAWAQAGLERTKKAADSAGKKTKQGARVLKQKVTGASPKPRRRRVQ